MSGGTIARSNSHKSGTWSLGFKRRFSAFRNIHNFEDRSSTTQVMLILVRSPEIFLVDPRRSRLLAPNPTLGSKSSPDRPFKAKEGFFRIDFFQKDVSQICSRMFRVARGAFPRPLRAFPLPPALPCVPARAGRTLPPLPPATVTIEF